MLHIHFLQRRPVEPIAESIAPWLQSVQHSAAACNEERVVVDLTTVEVVNSRELNEIARLQLALRERGKQLILENATRRVSEIFEITRMNRLVEVHSASSTGLTS